VEAYAFLNAPCIKHQECAVEREAEDEATQ
jgi:hypothetical protein